jgi:hypothetical protein
MMHLTLEEVYEYKLLNLHDSLPFITISAGSSNENFTESAGVLRSSSREWHKDLVAIAFYPFATRQFVVYGYTIYPILYGVAV